MSHSDDFDPALYNPKREKQLKVVKPAGRGDAGSGPVRPASGDETNDGTVKPAGRSDGDSDTVKPAGRVVDLDP